MTSKSQETTKNGSGHLHAKLVDEAEGLLRQFNVPACSTTLLDSVMDETLSVKSGPSQWSAYHQLVNVQRLQLESLFNCIIGFNKAACTGLQGRPESAHVRSDILRSILLSLSSLMFLRVSTTITMATHGSYLHHMQYPLGMNPVKVRLESAKLANDEGLASLKADCELILKLITQLTNSPEKKAPQP